MAAYALGAFLSRWYPATRHDLAASESETWRVAELLAMAAPADRARWDGLALGYTDPCGADFLRSRIAGLYDGIGALRIICFAGAQEALSVALRALLTPQDHAIMILPAYQPSEIALTSLCATTGVALDAASGWALDPDRIAAAIQPNTRLILANFPNNPTGRSLTGAALADLVALCRRHGLWLINDEVYREIQHSAAERPPRIADAYERGISIDALSKGYGLPGLRIGWMATQDADLRARAAALKQSASLCPSAPSEVLGAIALGLRPQLVARNQAIASENLALLTRFLNHHPALFDWHTPDAGTVGYVRYRGRDGVERFATRMADAAGVLVLPASVWSSRLAALPSDRFRISFGRRDMAGRILALSEGLARVFV